MEGYTRLELVYFLEEEMMKNTKLPHSFISTIRKSAEVDDVSFNLMQEYLKHTSPFNQDVVIKKLDRYLKQTKQHVT